MQPVLRLKRYASDILLKYGIDANEAIGNMNIRIQELEKELEREKAVTEALQNAFKHVPATGSGGSVTKQLQPFQPASTLKKIGKIDLDEELEDPVGRQGREV